MLRHHRFTLVELLAAMAVFAVLLLISMRLFSGTQRMWVRSEQKTNAFADTRAAMEFVAARLQTAIYYSVEEQEVPFGLTYENSASDDFKVDTSSIYFMTAMPMNRKKMDTSADAGKKSDTKKVDSFEGFRFLRFRCDKDGKLKMDIASSHNSRKFQYLAPPYEVYYTKTPTEGQIFDNDTFWKKNDTLSTVTIMKNVTSFKLVPFVAENGKLIRRESNLEEPPELLEIEISVIDNSEKFEIWNDNGTNADQKKSIQEEFGYTFRRAVVLGK